ncbi:Uncharacterised protein [Raoultella ornithinolytica]|jgi:hypothetical protein|nr:hypothetical protein AI2711V1_2761 [Raoultella ornithinolytica]CAH3544922.1 hypothetical protein AI2711V1_2761 [Raoultella ornithinolytica]STR71330.1 Uncharacterised protein [Raoultella ornithinolytica]VTM86178.1 Uncharacterised protein [Raoultella ornithinolytica]VTN05614.1 Uncharacterised protein [Raoultella ornithinolytica]
MACFKRILEVDWVDDKPQTGQVIVEVEAPPMNFIA